MSFFNINLQQDFFYRREQLIKEIIYFIIKSLVF